ncbi:MAG: hypothetical protein WDO73_23920 [Ignavibacteriota bacterium]
MTSTVNARASDSDQVFVATGFIEGTPAEIESTQLRDVLFSPQLVYPVKRFRRLPYAFDKATLPDDVAGSGRVFLITRRSTYFGLATGMQYESWLSQELIGYRATELGNPAGISLVVFER